MSKKTSTTKRRGITPNPTTPSHHEIDVDEIDERSSDSNRSNASALSQGSGEGGSMWGFLVVAVCLVLVLGLSHSQSMGRFSNIWRTSLAANTNAEDADKAQPVFVALPDDEAAIIAKKKEEKAKKAFKQPKVDGGRLPNFLGGGALASSDLMVATWNVRTLQNPFEFFLAEDDGKPAPHDAIVDKLDGLVHGDEKLPVGTFFTEKMYTQLHARIAAVDSVSSCLDSKYAEFAKMTPDQFLAVINERGSIDDIDPLTNPFAQSRGDVHYRPTPLGCGAGGDLADGVWWDKWLQFMFSLDVKRRGKAGSVYGMVKSSTVPCVGVRTLALAIYDAMMKGLLDKTGEDWEATRVKMCDHFHHNTTASVVAVLHEKYAGNDVVFLQGVTQKLIDDLRATDVGKRDYQIRTPTRFSQGHARNVAVLFKAGRFHGITEFTNLIPELDEYAGRVVGFTASRLDKEASKLAVVSYAGDTTMLHTVHNYLASQPTPMRQIVVGCSSRLDEGEMDQLTDFRRLKPLATGPTSKAVKTIAQRRYSEATSLAERTKEANIAVNTDDYIFYSGVDFEVVDGTTKSDLGAGILPAWDRPVIHGVVAGTLRTLAASDAVREESVAAVRRALLPTTEVPTTGEPAGEESTKVPVAVPERAEGGMDAMDGSGSGSGDMDTPPPPAGEGFQLPAPGVGEYVNLPEGQMYPFEAAHDTSHITVTAVCDNGLGDRLGSLYSAIYLAYTLKAKFHLMWNVNNECRARASVLFQFDGSSSSVQNRSHADNLEMKMQGHSKSFDAIITLKHHFSTGHLVADGMGTVDPPPGDGRWECGEARKVSLETTGPLITWAQNRHKLGKRVHILHHIDRLAKGVDLEGVTKAMKYYNFKINPKIMERVDGFCAKHKIHPQNTIGVHLRGTDARIPLRMNDVITDVRLRFPQRTFFVASDDKDAEGKFLSAFTGRAVSNTMKTHFPGKLFKDAPFRIQGVIGAGRFNVERGEPAVVDALTDMALLSRTERPIIDGVLRDSSFGKMSTTLCVIGLTCNEELAEIARSVKAPARPGS